MINRLIRFCGLRLRTFAASAFLSAAAFSSFAQTPLEMPQRLDRFHIWVNGNIVTNKYASDAEEYGIRMAQNARIYGKQDTGGVSLSKQLSINTKNGVVVAEAVQKINARQIGKGIAAVAGGPLGLALLGVPLVMDLLTESGLGVQDGVVGLYLGDTCNDACKEYTAYGFGFDGVYMKPSAFDAAMRSGFLAAQSPRTLNSSWISGNQWYVTYTLTAPCCGGVPAGTTGTGNYTIYSRSVAPYQGEFTPATPQQIEDAIATKNPSPAVLKELADKGGHAPNPDPADKPKIQNPQPSQEKVTTKTNPDGSSETTSCRTNGTATADGSIKLTESCTITKKDAQGNPTGTTTTTSDDADPIQPKEDYAFTDQPLPAQPVLYERKYPDGLVGVWNAKKTELDTAPLVQLVAQLMPDVSSVGTCPNWSLDLDMGVANMGVWDVSPPCYVWDFAKVVIICSALLLARALVFGG